MAKVKVNNPAIDKENFEKLVESYKEPITPEVAAYLAEWEENRKNNEYVAEEQNEQ